MILVTGATGLVGGHLLWKLLSEDCQVRAIVRNPERKNAITTILRFYTSDVDMLMDKVEWVMADVNDKESLLKAMEGVRFVYHCAAVVSLGNGSELLNDTNVLGTKNMVEAALESKVEKFCFVSSIAACGKSNGGFIDETLGWEDSPERNAYSRSKYFSEQEVWKGISKGLCAVIVNPGVILGVSGTKSGSSELFYRVKKGLPFYTLGGTGYVAVQDVATAMYLLMNSAICGERFILVGENCTNKQILYWMAKGFDKIPPFINMNKWMLIPVGYFLQFLGKLFRFKPLLDVSMAKSALNKEIYTSAKIINALNFCFTPMQQCIQEACNYLK